MKLENIFHKIIINCVPFLLCLFFIFFNQIYIFSESFYQFSVPLIFIVVFYFAIFNPRRLNGIEVFFLGLFADLLQSNFFGFYAFFLVLLFLISNLTKQLLSSLPFLQLWGVFTIIMFLFSFIEYIIKSALSTFWFPVFPVFIQVLLLGLFFPIVFFICIKINTKLGGE